MGSSSPWQPLSEMLIRRNRDLLFVGCYDTETFEPVSLAGSRGVFYQCTSPDGSIEDIWRIELTPAQGRALASHIRHGRTSMVRVDIAHLQFACLRHGTDGLTGMSNFNMEPRLLHEADRLLFSITHERYTRQDSAEGVHALHIAAILRDDLLVVGITKTSEVSVIKLIKELILMKDGNLELQSQPSLDSINGYENYDNTEQGTVEKTAVSETGRVQMRMSMKSDADKKTDQLKRQTSFCEDWRTATIRSIEALQKIGPFKDGNTDTQPLLDDAWAPAVSDVIREPERPRNTNTTTRTPEARRKSRVTVV